MNHESITNCYKSAAAAAAAYTSYEAPFSSKLNDENFQFRCLNILKKHLSATNSKIGYAIRSDLESKIIKTIGMNAIPQPKGNISMFPFIHFDDSGEYHISILFDCPPFSPWSAYTRNLFGSTFMRLQKEIYDLLLTNPAAINVAQSSEISSHENRLVTVPPPSLVSMTERKTEKFKKKIKKISAQSLLASFAAASSKGKKRPLNEVSDDVISSKKRKSNPIQSSLV